MHEGAESERMVMGGWETRRRPDGEVGEACKRPFLQPSPPPHAVQKRKASFTPCHEVPRPKNVP